MSPTSPGTREKFFQWCRVDKGLYQLFPLHPHYMFGFARQGFSPLRMESNMSVLSDILELKGFDISPELTYPLFFILLFLYVCLLFSNIGVLVLIITEKTLHQPMYILFCNLSVNDLLGNTAMLPQLMVHIISTDRFISYNACALQAFCSHTFGSASHMILMIGLSVRLTRCRSFIQNSYCDNASLFKLSCDDVSINNIYGLFFTVLLFSCSMGGIAATYIQIALICWTKKNKDLNSRALQTCASHLVVYLIMLWMGFLTIISHRLPNYPDLRTIAYVLFLVVPANLNPVIYGMQTKSLRDKIIQILQRKVTST
ncbi:olfactory receptor 52N5-like [Larimichthys crocea]|uniref:olfactory receptor 52N5-like n=1 Tax=Larimichthys crocea TaxID=215358 RepID=UPI000F5D9EC6|nr:olfactory receptor 52N5-like [Larimichthys crocea]